MAKVTPYWQSDCGRYTVYNDDCRNVMPHLDGVDLLVTSPPYLNKRTYGTSGNGFDWFEVVPSALASANMTSDGQIFVNLGLSHEDGKVVRYWDSLITAMEDADYRLFGWYVWDQTFGLPGDWNGRFGPSHEWVFHFNKEAKRPSKIVRCKERKGVVNGSGLRKKNDNTSAKMSHEGRPYQTHKIPDSVIRICREQRRNIGGHPAPYPIEFAQFLVRSFDGTVLDPFLGGGTTMLATLSENRPCIGIEKNSEYCDVTIERMKKASASLAEVA